MTFCTQPPLQVDLHGSQTMLSATVQLNLVVKAFCEINSSLSLWITHRLQAIFGVLAASLSDRIGRKPVALLKYPLLPV